MFNDADLVPGAYVFHPGQREWGIGQIQSAIDGRITVNFEHAGKVVINSAVIALEPAPRPSAGSRRS